MFVTVFGSFGTPKDLVDFFHSSFHILLSCGLCTVRGVLLSEWFAFIPCVSLLSSVGTLSTLLMLLIPWFGNYVFF